MFNRRFFVKNGIAGIVLAGVSPVVAALTPADQHALPKAEQKLKLRFAIASDGHYGQPGTDYKTDHANMVKWLNEAHSSNPLDFVIINGDLVNDRPDLLSEVKKDYFDHLNVPFYAVPGNHDHADTATWKSVLVMKTIFRWRKTV
jgi:predicted MPP superfamily phosphohydrolase